MLNILYVLIIILGLAVQNIVKKPYTEKTDGRGVYFFTACVSFFAMLFFAVTSGKPSFNVAFLPYSLMFALFYCMATVFNVLAVANGSLSLTSLLISYSLMLPTFFGLIFLDDPVGIGFIPGIALLVISLLFINGKSGEKCGITLKWVIQVVIALASNGMCSVVQKLQQIRFNGEYKNEFMIAALLAVTVVMAVAVLLKERSEIRLYIKAGRLWGMLCGIMNGVVNLFVMLASATMSMSLLFPLISAGGIITTFFASRFLYKERLTKLQLAGLITGVAAVVFLNI